ncbi:phage terminase small subunit P27 family [Edaphobacter sp. DSM 109919]|uniref:Phage terminase small subunit P27 family n=1 Tax=Edaphobacter paludis TaxID=3035702 RepID=A0AAU7CW58_9BACT
MGRKTKPTALKKLQGNPGRRALNDSEPQFSGTPKCPAWLDKDAKTEWKRVTRALAALKMLTAVDQAALAGYCKSYSTWKQAELLTTKHGIVLSEPILSKTGEVIGQRMKRNPATTIASDSLKSLARYGSLFGFDPSSRARLHISPNETADPFEEFLNAEDDETEDVSSGGIH